MRRECSGTCEAPGRSGFTLIEIVIITVLLGIIAVLVIPVLTQQLTQGDPVRASSDLAAVKLGVQSFHLDATPNFPGDLEDLVYRPSSAMEVGVDGDPYSGTLNSWSGPYLDAPLEESFADRDTGPGLPIGGGVQVENDLACFDAAGNAPAETCAGGAHMVALKVSGLDLELFGRMDAIIDGTTDAEAGNFRLPAGPYGYYLITPYR